MRIIGSYTFQPLWVSAAKWLPKFVQTGNASLGRSKTTEINCSVPTEGRVMNLIRIIRRLVREIREKLQCMCSTEGKIQILVPIIRRFEKSLFN